MQHWKLLITINFVSDVLYAMVGETINKLGSHERQSSQLMGQRNAYINYEDDHSAHVKCRTGRGHAIASYRAFFKFCAPLLMSLFINHFCSPRYIQDGSYTGVHC